MATVHGYYRLMNSTIPNPIKLAFLAFIAFAIFARAANAGTYTVTSTSCTGPGSITEAMALANANAGGDIITFTKDLQIDAAGCPNDYAGPGDNYYLLQATESVVFEGNGARLAGRIVWITSGGLNTPIGAEALCPSESGDLLIALTPGFIKVGTYGQDNSAITVTVRDLDMYELNSVARIEKNASLILEDLTLNRIIAGNRTCTTSAIRAEEGANFTARRTVWDEIWNGTAYVAPGLSAGAIVGIQGPVNSRTHAGNLTIEDSTFTYVFKGTIHWGGQSGDKVNIITSRFTEAGGIHIEGEAESNIVNSILSTHISLGLDHQVTDYLLNTSSQDMNIKASTVLFPSVACDEECDFGIGYISHEPGKGKINFVQSAIGVNVPNIPTPSARLLDPGDGTGFTADEFTWIQPTLLQDADALKTATNQPSLLTDPPALRTNGFFLTIAQWATPLDPGELIDRVPDAACGQGNQLLNPIDGSCITVDALGNPRVDANDKRNIGAVQLILAPHLAVTDTGDQTADLAWTKPSFSAPATGITGYQLRYRETSAATWTTVAVSGPESLTTQIAGLTNGTEYEFEIRATYSPAGEGPWSNNVKATLLGPLDPPLVTGTPGDGVVGLTWPTPPDNGSGPPTGYIIYLRMSGATDWIFWNAVYVNSANIGGLTNGVEYEFKVDVFNRAGVSSGFASAIPQAPLFLQYPSPVQISEGVALTLYPTYGNVVGTGSYAFSGAAPAWLNLDPVTGVLSGTPPVTGSDDNVQVTVELSRTGPPAGTAQANVEIQVQATGQNPYLKYVDLTGPAGAAVSLTPTVAGLTAPYTFSNTNANLPPGLALTDAATGIISGAPTTVGFWDVEMRVVDSNTQQAANPVFMTITPTIAYASVDTTVGTPVSVQPTVPSLQSGRTYTYALTGSLPPGLSFNPATGAISGTPTASSNTAVDVEVSVVLPTGTYSVTTHVSLVIRVYQIDFSYPQQPTVIGEPFSLLPAVSGTVGPVTFAPDGTLPDGVTLDPDTGRITGVMTSALSGQVLQIVLTDGYTSRRAPAVLEGISPPIVYNAVPVPMFNRYGGLAMILLVLGVGYFAHRRW